MIERPGFIRCYHDGCLIPRVDKPKLWPVSFTQCYWCHWCQELFVLTGRSERELHRVATFGYDVEKAAYSLKEAYGTNADVDLAKEAVVKLRFVPSASAGTSRKAVIVSPDDIGER